MRLICPNCEAQYDVSDDAIPPGGRDVQCSNCQQSWFQMEKPVVPGRDTSQKTISKLPDVVEIPDIDDDETAPDMADQDAIVTPPKTARKGLDSAVANILRQEATREGAVPSGPKSAPPPTQVDRPAEVVDASETRQRIAQMTVEEGGTPAGRSAAVAAASVGAVTATNVRAVPDIHEINAALRARAEASDTSGLTEDEKQEAAQRGGFRRGFTIILLLMAILMLPYIFADQITENLPQTRGIMASYVTTIDQMRLALNDFISSFISG